MQRQRISNALINKEITVREYRPRAHDNITQDDVYMHIQIYTYIYIFAGASSTSIYLNVLFYIKYLETQRTMFYTERNSNINKKKKLFF
jgi:hypothetical protein